MVNLLGITPTPRIVVAACGAGIGLIRDLWKTPGASEYLVAAHLPYSQVATDDYLGFCPDKYVCEETAWHLAATAYMEALRAGGEGNHIGLGLTASIAGIHAHRGDHVGYEALIGDNTAESYKIEIPKRIGENARLADDEECSSACVDLIYGAATRDDTDDDRSLTTFMTRPVFYGRTERRATPRTTDIFFPGAFNPMHNGHTSIFETVEHMTGQVVVPMITIDPPHKPKLSIQDVCRRVVGCGSYCMISQGDPLYIDKARRYPGQAFVIGADALIRMLDPKWGPEPGTLLREFGTLGTRFYVVGREVEGRGFVDAASAIDVVGHEYGSAYLFHPVPGRWDVSSTEIRNEKV